MPFDCPCADCALDLINNIGYYPCVLLNIVSVYNLEYFFLYERYPIERCNLEVENCNLLNNLLIKYGHLADLFFFMF